MKDTKLSDYNKSIRREMTKVVVDLPRINMDNAILYFNRDITNKYYNSLNIDPIHSGLVLYKSQYYYFNYDILGASNRTKVNDSPCFSYSIYLLKDDYAKELINTRQANYWELIFHSFFNFSKTYLSVGIGDYVTNYISESRIENDTLIIPYEKSPSSLRDKCLISEYLDQHRKDYPKSLIKMDINTPLLRDMLLSELID